MPYNPTQSLRFPGPLVTVAVIVAPGKTVAAPAVTAGVPASSSLTMGPAPCESAIVALVGCDRLTKNVSFCSKVASPVIATLIVRVVVDGSNVNVPLVAV